MAGKSSKKSAKVAKKAASERVAAKPALLSGGNPQIAKADGDAPVQAYLAAMPGWKRNLREQGTFQSCSAQDLLREQVQGGRPIEEAERPWAAWAGPVRRCASAQR